MMTAKPEKIHESLAILRILNIELTDIVKLLDEANLKCREENNQINYIRYYVFYGRIILHAKSFLDEYKILKSELTGKYDIKKLELLIKPLNQRLSKWKHLERYRNIYFAHNFRDKEANYKFIFYDDYLHTLDVPISHFDVKLIAKIIDFMFYEIADFLTNEMFEATLFLGRSENENEELREKLNNKSVQSEVDYINEVNRLKETLDDIKKNY